jgi:hypothetical protein
MMATNCLVLFSDWAPVEQGLIFGWIYVGLIVLLITINLVFVLYFGMWKLGVVIKKYALLGHFYTCKFYRILRLKIE